MKRANGAGCITKVKGRRVKPYRVSLPIGTKFDKKTGKLKRKRIELGYADTVLEGEMMISKYLSSKERLSDPTITFEEVYAEWKKRHFVGKSEKTINSYENAHSICWQLDRMKMIDIKPYVLQDVIDCSDKNYPTLKIVKIFLGMIFKFALNNDMVLRDYSQAIDITKYKDRNPNKQIKRRLTDSEIERLWENVETKYEHIFMILIYTGVRINELLTLRKSDVNMDEHYFEVVRSKTGNGIRTVPIADKIYPFFEEWMNNCPESEYVFSETKLLYISYETYRRIYFKKIKEDYGIDDFSLHCCRHTFISMMTKKNINPTIIKKIVGHSTKMSLTERVYTHFEPQELLDAVNQI